MTSKKLIEFIANEYNILDTIHILKTDHDISAIYHSLAQIKKDVFDPNDRIVIVHDDIEYFYYDCPVGFTTHNLFKIIQTLDIPQYVFVFIANDSGYDDVVKKFESHEKDRPTVLNPLINYTPYSMLVNQEVYSVDPVKNIKFRALCLLGTRRSHRERLFQFFQKNQLQSKINYTFNNSQCGLLSPTKYTVVPVDQQKISINDVIYSYPHKCNDGWCNSIHDYPELQELNKIELTPTANSYIDSYSDMSFYNSHAIDIVVETVFDYPNVYLTEKTLRPILLKTPFIIFGCSGILKHLQSFGIKTFSNFWNEDYDTIVDPRDRFLALTDLTKEICKLEVEQLKKMYIEMEPILEHNRNIVLEYTSNIIKPLNKKINLTNVVDNKK